MNEPANQLDGKYSCPKNDYDWPQFRISKIKSKVYNQLN